MKRGPRGAPLSFCSLSLSLPHFELPHAPSPASPLIQLPLGTHPSRFCSEPCKDRRYGRPHLYLLQRALQKWDPWAPIPLTSAGGRIAPPAKGQVRGLSFRTQGFLNAEVGPVGAHTSTFCSELCKGGRCGRPDPGFPRIRAQKWPLRVPAPGRLAQATCSSCPATRGLGPQSAPGALLLRGLGLRLQPVLGAVPRDGMLAARPVAQL